MLLIVLNSICRSDSKSLFFNSYFTYVSSLLEATKKSESKSWSEFVVSVK